jgi:hypothetical protein
MKRAFIFLLAAITPAIILFIDSNASHQTVNAQSTGGSIGPLFSSREKLVLTRDKTTNQVTGGLDKGTIAVAYVNLWSRQTVERAGALYTPVATITEVQPVILFSHCDLPYKFAIEQGKLHVTGQCTNPNWAESPIDVVVLYSK